MAFRLICDDAVSHSFGLAADETIARRTGAQISAPTLRLYTYRPCVLVGRFQVLEHELHLDYCRTNVISINRRPTSGRAALMGPDQLAVALMLPGSRYADDRHSADPTPRDLFTRFAGAVSNGLAELCLDAGFEDGHSLSIAGRKIADLGCYRASTGGVLLHALIPVDSDVIYRLRVFSSSFRRLSQKDIADMATRSTDIRSEVGWEISIGEVRRRLAKSFADAFDTTLQPGAFEADERHAIDKLELHRYMDRHWIYRSAEVIDRLAGARIRSSAGHVDVRVAVDNDRIKMLFIGGDFFAAEEAITELEQNLRRHSCEQDAIAATLAKTYRKRAADLNGITLSELTTVIQQAVDNAINRRWSDTYADLLTGEI